MKPRRFLTHPTPEGQHSIAQSGAQWSSIFLLGKKGINIDNGWCWWLDWLYRCFFLTVWLVFVDFFWWIPFAWNESHWDSPWSSPKNADSPRKSVTNQSAYDSCNAMKLTDMAHAETIKQLDWLGDKSFFIFFPPLIQKTERSSISRGMCFFFGGGGV